MENNILVETAKKAYKHLRKLNDPLRDGERYADGGNLIVCTKCNKPKWAKTYSHIGRFHYWTQIFDDGFGCDCDRAIKKRQIEEENAAAIKRIYTSDKYMAVSKGYLRDCSFNDEFVKGLPERIKTHVRSLFTYCRDYQRSKDTGFYIYSDNAGLFKTSMMACARNMLLDKGVPCILTNVADIADAYQNDRDMYWNYVNVEVLIIDDIGIQDPKKTKASYMGLICDSLYELLNARMHRKGEPTLFTSNYSPHELETQRGLSMQIVDRIRGMITNNIYHVEGESIRGN